MEQFMHQLKKKKAHLSRLENEVFEFILANPNKIVQLTLDELSAEIFISTATISRTAKQMGFKGYQELRYALNQYISQEKGNWHEISFDDNLNDYSQVLLEQLRQTAHSFKKSSQSVFTDLIEHANVIELFGVGGSLPNCVDAARKLTFLGKKANARTDWDELRAIASNLTTNDLGILVSNSGETIHIIEYASILQQAKVPTISIVGTKNSTLEKLTTHTLIANTQLLYYDEVDLTSRISLAFILDSLILNYASKLKQNDL